MIAKGRTLARVRRGPLRKIAARLPSGEEVLECGHRTGAGLLDRVADRALRRCPICPYDRNESRVAYERDYHRERYRRLARTRAA